MAKEGNPNRIKSFDLYKESNGRMTSRDIAEQLNETVNNVNYWRSVDKWRDKVGKVGAPYGNQNGLGNKGGPPLRNKNHYINGFYSKYFPQESVDIMKDTEDMEPIDFLYFSIRTKFTAIVRAQKLMFVKDQDDMTKELKKTKDFSGKDNSGSEEEYEIQFAWDKQANFLKAQAVAMGQLTNMIRRYEELLHTNWDTATEEQKLRVKKLESSIKSTQMEIQNRRQIAEDKLQLAQERFGHQKDIDKKKYW